MLEDEKIRMHDTAALQGRRRGQGVKEQGGVLSHLRNDVEVTCLPKDLPEFIEVDVSSLELNQVMKLSDLKLPRGCRRSWSCWPAATRRSPRSTCRASRRR